MCRQRNSRSRQGGAAIIVALLIMALATATASQLMFLVNEWLESEALVRDRRQALELARAGLDWGRAVLAQDARQSALDAPSEDWARILPPIRHELGEISGRIEDAQGRFNLNSLRRHNGQIDEQALTAYRRLLAVLGLPDVLADTLADWLDADLSPRAAGHEHETANAPLEHLASLAYVRGYDERTRHLLARFVSVFDGEAPVNLNTASAEVLAAIQPGLSISMARELTQQRLAQPFRDVADFQLRLPASGLPGPLVAASSASRHFLIRVDGRSGEAQVQLIALIQRIGDGSRSRILWQESQ